MIACGPNLSRRPRALRAVVAAVGKLCYVAWSGTDSISVFSYRKEREIAHVEVGDHPQRIRTGFVRRSWLRRLR